MLKFFNDCKVGAVLLKETERYNLPRFRGHAPFYEVYYLRFTDLKQKIAVWYRQTILAQAGKPAEAALWLMLYDLIDPTRSLAFRKATRFKEARLEKDIFYFEVLGGKLYHNGSDGAIETPTGPIRWQLSWQPNQEPFFYVPWRGIYWLPLAKTQVICPNPDLRIDGELSWGERHFHFKAVPGQQSHLWGSSHAPTWVWGHVNAFAAPEDKSYFEALAVTLKKFGRDIPLTLFRFKHQGADYRFNSLTGLYQNRSHAGPTRWHLEGQSGTHRLIGDVFAEPEQSMGVTYTDPNGSKRYCYHTESARLELKLFKKGQSDWVPDLTLNSLPAMAYEWVTSEALAGASLKL